MIPDLDEDEDLAAECPADVDATVRIVAAWVDTELARLRKERKNRDSVGLAEITRLKQNLIRDRKALNVRIAELVTEQERLTRLIRVLDRK